MLGAVLLILMLSWLATYFMCTFAKSHQSYLTLSDSVDCSSPGSSVPGILQARMLEWVAMPCFRGSSWPRDQTHVSCIAGGFSTDEPPGKPLSILYIVSIVFMCPSQFIQHRQLYSTLCGDLKGKEIQKRGCIWEQSECLIHFAVHRN